MFKTINFVIVIFCFLHAKVSSSQCNGSIDSCNKKYNEVAYLTTHNAFNSPADGFPILPNQNNSIETQLNEGVRALMIDVYDSGGTPIVYHGSSFIGSKPLSNFLVTIKSFLDNNPNEVITIIFQNDPGLSATAIENDFNQTGIASYLHTQNKFLDWPTLQTMINNNKRLVVFNEVNNASSSQGWYHHIWDFAVEINYGSINCDYGRGNPSNGLFVFNHFITPANQSDANTSNSNPYFINHVTQCQEAKNKFPNFITVDFYDLGDAMAVVNQLNALNTGSGDGSGNSGNPPGNGSDNTAPEILQLQNGGQLIIKANASLNLKGLKLTPNIDYTLVANNATTRSLDALGNAPNQSMARVFNFMSAINNFKGAIIYYYDDVDMGDITHNDAVLQVKNDMDVWNSFPDEDSSNNQATYTFTAPIKIKSVTASASSTTLSINPVIEDLKISFYPVPVTTFLNIKYNGNLSVTVFNFIGQSVIETNSKTINMSALPNGIYVVKIKDKALGKTNSYKVIKK